MYSSHPWRHHVSGVVVALLIAVPLSAVYQGDRCSDPSPNGAMPPLPNHPPEAPTLEGPRTGTVDTPCHFTACACDPDGDHVYYTFDWGDGCTCTVACCYASGEPCTVCHVWHSRGVYQVRACAADEHYCYGAWCDPLPLMMPKKAAAGQAVGVNSK